MGSALAPFSPLTSSTQSAGLSATTGVAPTPMTVMLPSLCNFGPFNESPAGRKVCVDSWFPLAHLAWLPVSFDLLASPEWRQGAVLGP